MSKVLIRNVSVRRLLDNLFVSAVATVLIIRTFLYLTGWPSIGGEKLHIAHMLWGGFFMLSSIILLLSFLGKRVQYWSAILGGIGFGFFIDELGKFITRNNDYFFQPTFMLMYIIFVALFFVIRKLEKETELTEEEKAANLMELSEDDVIRHVNEFENQLISLYSKFARSQYFIPSVVLLWIVQGGVITYSFSNFWTADSATFIGKVIVVLGVGFAVIAGSNILRGIFELPKDRLLAYRNFYRGNLISVLLMQPFLLYVSTFGPIVALWINLSALFALQYLISVEKRK